MYKQRIISCFSIWLCTDQNSKISDGAGVPAALTSTATINTIQFRAVCKQEKAGDTDNGQRTTFDGQHTTRTPSLRSAVACLCAVSFKNTTLPHETKCRHCCVLRYLTSKVPGTAVYTMHVPVQV